MPFDRDVQHLFDEAAQDEPMREMATADQIAYMADLIGELERLARRAKLLTLAGILDLAHAEALLQSARLGNNHSAEGGSGS